MYVHIYVHIFTNESVYQRSFLFERKIFSCYFLFIYLLSSLFFYYLFFHSCLCRTMKMKRTRGKVRNVMRRRRVCNCIRSTTKRCSNCSCSRENGNNFYRRSSIVKRRNNTSREINNANENVSNCISYNRSTIYC